MSEVITTRLVDELASESKIVSKALEILINRLYELMSIMKRDVTVATSTTDVKPYGPHNSKRFGATITPNLAVMYNQSTAVMGAIQLGASRMKHIEFNGLLRSKLEQFNVKDVDVQQQLSRDGFATRESAERIHVNYGKAKEPVKLSRPLQYTLRSFAPSSFSTTNAAGADFPCFKTGHGVLKRSIKEYWRGSGVTQSVIDHVDVIEIQNLKVYESEKHRRQMSLHGVEDMASVIEGIYKRDKASGMYLDANSMARVAYESGNRFTYYAMDRWHIVVEFGSNSVREPGKMIVKSEGIVVSFGVEGYRLVGSQKTMSDKILIQTPDGRRVMVDGSGINKYNLWNGFPYMPKALKVEFQEDWSVSIEAVERKGRLTNFDAECVARQGQGFYPELPDNIVEAELSALYTWLSKGFTGNVDKYITIVLKKLLVGGAIEDARENFYFVDDLDLDEESPDEFSLSWKRVAAYVIHAAKYSRPQIVALTDAGPWQLGPKVATRRSKASIIPPIGNFGLDTSDNASIFNPGLNMWPYMFQGFDLPIRWINTKLKVAERSVSVKMMSSSLAMTVSLPMVVFKGMSGYTTYIGETPYDVAAMTDSLYAQVYHKLKYSPLLWVRTILGVCFITKGNVAWLPVGRHSNIISEGKSISVLRGLNSCISLDLITDGGTRISSVAGVSLLNSAKIVSNGYCSTDALNAFARKVRF